MSDGITDGKRAHERALEEQKRFQDYLKQPDLADIYPVYLTKREILVLLDTVTPRGFHRHKHIYDRMLPHNGHPRTQNGELWSLSEKLAEILQNTKPFILKP